MDLSFRFDRWFERLPASPRDRGRVERCVLRTGKGERQLPQAVRIEPGRGALGLAAGPDGGPPSEDHWGVYDYDEPGNEISLVNVHVIASLASGDPAKMALSGDNFQVDLDLSEENLPVGTELWLGEALLRISPMPHRPCLKFVTRFGPGAAKKVARANRIGRRGRGVLCEVLAGGVVRVGDAIEVRRS